MTHEIVNFVLQIGIILIAAKIVGGLFERMGQSSVLGELIAGMIIGPFALGAIDLPFFGQIFAMPEVQEIAGHAEEAASTLPVSGPLYAFGQLGAIILLFMVGLETDAKMFMKYGVKSLGIAIGGVVLPFFLGAWGTVLFGFADSLMDPHALFMGAIMTATSVGITARVLADLYKLDTDEGVSILAAAVIDDVLGILVLAFVLSLAGSGEGAAIDWSVIGIIGVKALGFLGVVTVLGILFGKRLSRFLMKLQGKTYLAITAAIVFILAALAEKFGLAMIIGAYLAGILLSVTEIAHEIEERLTWVAHLIVPVFFAVMGMLVDFKAMSTALVFGAVISLFAIVGKIIGCGVPALFSGFNFLGASRIGIGMLPRGEVALIVAGIGLAAGVVSQEIFGVAIMMTLVTTIIAPIALVPLFKKTGSGLRNAPVKPRITMIEPLYNLQNLGALVDDFRDAIIEGFVKNGYDILREEAAEGITELEHESEKNRLVTIRTTDTGLTLDVSAIAAKEAQYIVDQSHARFSELVQSLKPEPQTA